MKIVFLDFDGVLNSAAFFSARDGEQLSRANHEHDDIDPCAIVRLNRIVTETLASIVVSSSWRKGKTVARLQEILDARGFVGQVLDKTPDHIEPKHPRVRVQRGDQIAHWIAANPGVRSFVVLDDDSDMDAVASRHIKTSFHDGGLLDSHVERAISMLAETRPERAADCA